MERNEDWRRRTAISIPEAAEILGIPESTAYRAAANGDLPVIRLGRRKIVVVVARLEEKLGLTPLADPAA